MGSPSFPTQKMVEAAGGNAALLELLQQISQATAATQFATRTVPLGGSAQTKAATAPVPGQGQGTVSVLAGVYTVQIVNPGSSSAVSQIQKNLAVENGGTLASLQPTAPIFHQIRVSTSPAFNVNSNTQTFGGDKGSTQTLWTLTGLGSGTWYVQFRSSYDGINFNLWRNTNGGAALGRLVDQVTLESAGNAEWALFSMPGKLVVGVGAGIVADAEIFDLATQVYSSGMFAIATPAAASMNNAGIYGVTLCDVNVVVPSGPSGITGIPDYPVEVRMQYGSTSQLSAGNANVFAIAFDPTNENVTLYEQGGTNGAVWASFKLPGGARIAIGQGKNADGTSIWKPSALTWLTSSNMMSICSMTGATSSASVASGVNACALSGFTMNASYQNTSGGSYSGTANWLAIAWQPGVDVQTVNGFPFISIQLQGGHAVMFGAGVTAQNGLITFPTGYSYQQMLGICSPANTVSSGGRFWHSVAECDFGGFVGPEPTTWYQDGQWSTGDWGGSTNWLIALWK